jgi:MarR family transcriptional regulator, organic hydroperoxide resistance regulator
MGYVLADRFYAVSAAMQQVTGKMLQELGLTEALADALWQLDPADGPLPRRSLAARLHCDPSNVTFLVDRLEERGLVERVADSHDRRIKAIGLTVQGMSVREALVRATALNPVFTRLTAPEQQQLAELLDRCVDPPVATEQP